MDSNYLRISLEGIIDRAVNILDLVNSYRGGSDDMNQVYELTAYKEGVHDGLSVFLNELNLLLLEMKEE